ncbi:hypothetical protein O181_025281 [Austropuccinia psidii MF-1]|uniref:Integrase catalytic domain-containing protein n=1 Tax=Austropuccinia psidii MF-1 TaxID=1389203 RepID=A0A9Q3CI85_9BASI|nr:hypothetical protein [Austropuccinia psidii MF-1]
MAPLPNNPIVIQQYGSKCSYCQQDGHWYVDCVQFKKDYKEKGLRLKCLPRRFQYMEPHTSLTNNHTKIHAIQPDIEDDNPDIIDARHISELDDRKILIDSSASAHVSGVSPFLCDIRALRQPIPLLLEDSKAVVQATAQGRLSIQMKNGTIDVKNLYEQSFELLHLHFLIIQLYSTTTAGYASEDHLKIFLKRFVPEFDIKTWKPVFCEQCAKSKGALRQPDLGKSIVTYDDILDFVVSDVVGPITANDTEMSYFVTLQDHKSTFALSKPIVYRSAVVEALQQWLEFFKTNKGAYTKFLQTDNAKEYVSAALTSFCDERGIKNVPVIAYMPSNDGEAKRLNKTICEAGCTMLSSSRLPEKFWPYVYQVATYLHNRIPNKQTNNSTPIELMFGMKPSTSMLFKFGSKAIIQLPSPNQPKLAPHAYIAILVGYPSSSRGWIFYVPSNHSIVHSLHAVFP